MDVSIAEEGARRKIAPGVRRIRWLGWKGLLGGCLIECANVRYGLFGCERWQSEAGHTRYKNDPDCLFHKSVFLPTTADVTLDARCRAFGRKNVDLKSSITT